MKKEIRPCTIFPLSTGLAILGIQHIITVLKIISRHLSPAAAGKIVLKGNTDFSGHILGMLFTAILIVVSCTTDLHE